MNKTWRSLLLLLGILAICTTLVWAQTDEAEYVGNFNLFAQIIQSIIWGAIYLLIYAAALFIPLAYLRLYNGFDVEMLWWLGATWAGGMIMNAIAYGITSHHFLAALIALPLIFGWSVLIGTRSFVDLVPMDAARISLVVALMCAPWFGPTWRVHHAPKPPTPVESRMQAPLFAALPSFAVER